MQYPVRNRFPMLASAKLKTDVGRALFTISMLSVLRTDRMSSLLGLEMKVQSRCRASTMSSHSVRALIGSELRRYSNRALTAVFSSSPPFVLGINLTSRPFVCGGVHPSSARILSSTKTWRTRNHTAVVDSTHS